MDLLCQWDLEHADPAQTQAIGERLKWEGSLDSSDWPVTSPFPCLRTTPVRDNRSIIPTPELCHSIIATPIRM